MGEGYVYPNAGNNAPHAPPAYYTVTGGKGGPGGSLPYPAVYTAPKRRRSCCCCLWAWLCSLLVIFIVAVGIAALVFWLVVRPKLPEYDVTDVRLTGLNDSVSRGQLNTGLSFTLDTYNPNKKMGFYYDEINVRVETLNLVVGEGQIPPFYHGHRNRTIVSQTLKSQQVPLSTDNKNKLLQASNDNKLLLHVKVDVKTRVKVGDVKSNRIKVKVRCDVEINPLKAGNQVLKLPELHGSSEVVNSLLGLYFIPSPLADPKRRTALTLP
ncbi:hypothetical protein R1sor_006887 [Riccia sorocarpa]|uniref:Late embryogenesis abundant protein LEA-2 subgroup domain-containing protein n=1 Tax=Riccia sorocarpa TaxID=122646 RepID=A0ABD3HSY9_9MARC